MSIFTKTDGTQADGPYKVQSFRRQEIIPEGTIAIATVSGVATKEVHKNNREKHGDYYFVISFIIDDGEYKDYIVNKSLYSNSIDKVEFDKAVNVIPSLNDISKGKLEKLAAKCNSISDLTESILNAALPGNKALITVSIINGSYVNKEGITVETERNYISGIDMVVENKPQIKADQYEDIDDEVPF